MAKKPKVANANSSAVSRQKDAMWTLALQANTPINSHKIWEETAHSLYVPKRLFIAGGNSQTLLQDRKIKKQWPRFALRVVLKGAGQVCLDERIFRLDEGQALLVFPFQFRQFGSLQGSPIRWLSISFEMEQTDFLESLRNQTWSPAPESMQILHRLLEAVSSKNPTQPGRVSEAQLWLALFLNKNISRQTRLPLSALTVSTEAQKLLERIHGFVYRRLDQPFKVEDMARGVGCSRSYLDHQFKEIFKMSLGHYVAQMRLKKAAALLRENSPNISGVAQACGYSSLYAFGRAFRAAMGCTPREYRAQIHKGM